MQWCTKNNFLIASSIHINWCFKNLSKCVHRLQFQILQNYFYSCFQCVQFSNLYLNVFCYFHSTQIFVKTLIYLQALAGSGSCVIACTPPQTIRWKFQKYSASLIKLELLFFFFIYLSVRQQQAVQSFVPLSVCLFFEAASSFTITCTHAFTVSSFQSLNTNVFCHIFIPSQNFRQTLQL